jgi:hypothetical protein
MRLITHNAVDFMKTQPHVAQIQWRSETFKVGDQNYVVLRFTERMWPTLARAITIAEVKGMEMLTLEEAREIIDNSELNIAFRNILKPGDWTYIRNPESEKGERAATFSRGCAGWHLYAGVIGREVLGPSWVLILKETASGVERELRDMQFQEYVIQRGMTLYAARSPQCVRMDLDATKKALEIKGLELVSYRILIPGIDQNAGLRVFSKGRGGFVAERGPIDERFVGRSTWDPKTGELKELGNERDEEKIIQVWQGRNQLALGVASDESTSAAGRRFYLFSYHGMTDPPVSVVWGTKLQAQAELLSQAKRFTAYGGMTPVEYALVSGSKEVREALAHHIEYEAGGRTAVSTALLSDDKELRVLVSEALRNRRST